MSFEPSPLTRRPDFEERIHADDPFLDQGKPDWADHTSCTGCEICTNVFDDLNLSIHKSRKASGLTQLVPLAA